MSDAVSISADGVRAAARRLNGVIRQTPLLECEVLNARTGGRVFVKAEPLQHCGSFKLRGAYNLIAQLPPAVRAKGILAWSSGNHAQGVARAAKFFDAPATIIMPADAPAIKTDKVRALGAEIIVYDRYRDDREAMAQEILNERGLALAPSYDHAHIIEGQGTVGLEIALEAQQRGVALDALIVCCGGGGLTAGCATILEDLCPQTDVWIAEPEGFDESWASIKAGERVKADITRRTLCDAIATPTPGRLTFPIMQRRVRGGAAVSDIEVETAMAFAFKHFKLVVEPGGAAALAALLAGKVDARGKTVALTLSGGNVDPGLFAEILARHQKSI